MKEKPNKPIAIISYAIPLLGPLIAYIVAKRNLFALYHACQSLAISILAIALPVVWVLISYAIAWVPMAGPTMSAALFTIVIVGLVTALLLIVTGIGNAARGNMAPLFLIGRWGDRLFIRLYPEPIVELSI